MTAEKAIVEAEEGRETSEERDKLLADLEAGSLGSVEAAQPGARQTAPAPK